MKPQYLAVGVVLLMASQGLVADRPRKPELGPWPALQEVSRKVSRTPVEARGRTCTPPGLESFTISELEPHPTEYGNAGYVIDRSGHYVLAGDLDARALDVGILVLAGNVVLDFDRRTLLANLGTPILVTDHSPRLTVRNGTIDGGSEGIVATVGGTWGAGSLAIERMVIRGPRGAAGHSIVTNNVRDVRIASSRVEGARTGIALSGWTTSRILDSEIIATEVGLETQAEARKYYQYARQEITGNRVEAPLALSTGSYSFIEGNRVRGAVELGSNLSRAADNDIRVTSGDYALTVAGDQHLIEGNRISGGTKAVIRILGATNRVTGNDIAANSTGVEVMGGRNLIEHNLIEGARLTCGIQFVSNDNVYRGNVTSGNRTPLCGEVNIDGGAGVPAATPEPPGPIRSPSTRLEPAIVSRAADCPQEAPIPIDGPSPANTPVGPATVLIDRSGYYVLTHDLPVQTTYGIVIDAPDVTLDLGGHVVSCDRYCGQMIVVLGGERVAIRNGFVSGILADGTADFRLADIVAGCGGSSGCLALDAGNIGHLEIVDSRFHGVESCAHARASTALITGSEFHGIEGALLAGFTGSGTLRNNLFVSDRTQVNGNSTVEDNVVVGELDAGHVTGTHRIAGNMIVARGEFSLDLHSPSVVEGNLFKEGRTRIHSAGSHVRDNFVVHHMPPSAQSFWVQGEGHVLEDNFIVGGTCGLWFDRVEENTYRDNVVIGAGEGVCGIANTNDGGNVFPAPTCGNGFRGESETCDGYDSGGQGCSDLGYEGGGLDCTDACEFDVSDCLPGACGNGIKEGDEWCDGDELGSRTTCLLFGGFDSGELRCGSSCDYDLSHCTLICGNGLRRGDEVCDGADLGGATCVSLGFDGGDIACDQACRVFDTSGCATICGNGKRSPSEVCDAGDLGGQTCVSRGFSAGSLACNASCEAYVTSGCSTCGNNLHEGEEVCDGADLGGKTCGTFGFTKGMLACASDCTADISDCGV